MLEAKHIKATIVTVVAVSMSIFQIYTAQFGIFSAMVQRPIHMTFAYTLLFLLYPTKKEKKKWWAECLDWFFIIISAVVFIHLVLTYRDVIFRGGAATKLDLWLGSILILLTLEGSRRVLGWPLPILAGASILYALLGHHIPGILGHHWIDLETFLSYQYLTTEAIFGTPIGVCATFVYMFILFGAFLIISGTSQFFIDFANALTGHLKGGPAKVAVISSSFFGTISGSCVANVVGTGSFTIPLMKRLGYRPLFAGAVEAASSCGGQIMPPIMGAAAFILADFVGVPYIRVAIAAALPSLLYYVALIYMVHLEAIRLGLKGLPKAELPNLWEVVKQRGYLLIPAFLLIFWLVRGYSPIKAGVWAVGAVFVFSLLKRESRMGPRKLIEALKRGGTGCLEVVTACACAGIVIGMVTQTGLGLKFSTIIIEASKGFLPVALVFIAITSLIMGMGLTTSAAYILTVIFGGPVLINLGVPPLAAHLFVFYYACLSAITPPVALAAFAAGGVAGASPFGIGFMAVRLALIAYVVPFFFVYQPVLIWEGPILQILFALSTALLGCIAIGSSLMGEMLGPVRLFPRLILFVGGLMLIKPGLYTDTVGLIALACIFGLQLMKRKRFAKQPLIPKEEGIS